MACDEREGQTDIARARGLKRMSAKDAK